MLKLKTTSKYDILTKHIPLLEKGKYGEWFVDEENDGSFEHPIQMPYVMYSDIVDNFVNDVSTFVWSNEDMGLTNYRKILDDNGILEDPKSANIDECDAKCICALIVANVRAERFCEGAILSSCKEGTFVKWLKRLKGLS